MKARNPSLDPGYAELCCTSNFTFLRGASHPEELVSRAAQLGLNALAITDHNSLAGVVRAYSALKELRRELGADAPLPRLVIGARLILRDSDTHWVALPHDREAYARLTRLLTLGKRRAPKGACYLDLPDLVQGCAGMSLIAVPQASLKTSQPDIATLKKHFPADVFIGVAPRYDGSDQRYFDACATLAHRTAAPMVAVGDVLMHHGARRQLADVLTCLRHNITIDQIGTRALPNAEKRLKPEADMKRLFARHPAALRRTTQIAARSSFCLSELSYDYPDEIADNETPQDRLARLASEGLKVRYPKGAPARAITQMEKELALVKTLDFPAYFLTVHDIVQFARSKGILCQGRGSAANSILCYLLGITDVSPETITMVVERFVSEHRGEPPDIDVDFEHERREEVIQHIYAKYGRHRAGLCATVIHYRPRSAIREVGKAMGLSEDVTSKLAGTIWGSFEGQMDDDRAREAGLDLSDPYLRMVLKLASQMIGMPRHLSQHVGGFILTERPLTEIVPIGNGAMPERSFIEWDKDDIDALRFMKVDVLALGMLTCMKRGLDLLAEHKDIRLDLATIPAEEPRTYAMIRKADTLGTFQIESRAQMSMLPRLKPRTYYDLVVQVAIVRPGPIQGDMVHPYLRRREGLEPVHYPKPELEKVLGKTLGVPLFQEQAMRVAIECAGFTPGEADMLRKSMATFKHTGGVSAFEEKLVSGMVANGYDEDFAQRTFKQLEGFGSYGFPESHAASFALIAYASAWLKCWHPDVFCAALLNSQPMGFYAPAQIVRDARDHGVEIRPVCINASRWDCTLEPTEDDTRFAVRLGLRRVKGLANADAATITAARGDRPFASIDDLWKRAGVPVAALTRIAEADGFRAAFGLARREALWAIKALRDEPLPLFAAAAAREDGAGAECNEPPVALRPMTAGREVVEDYGHLGLSLRSHPVAFLRANLSRRRIVTCRQAMEERDGRWLEAAGIVLVRQRPGSAKGVCFITLEDETGVVNLVVWPDLKEKQRKVVMGARLMEVRGRVEYDEEVIHVIAHHMTDATHMLSRLSDDALRYELARADHVNSPLPSGKINPRDDLRDGAEDPAGGRAIRPRDLIDELPGTGGHPRNVRIIPKSRDFH